MRYQSSNHILAGSVVALGFSVALGAGCMLPTLESSAYSGDASQQPQNSDPGKADSQQPNGGSDDAGGVADSDNGGNGGEDTGSEKDTGGDDSNDSGNGGNSGPEFSDVRTIIENNCGGGTCHGGGASNGGFGFNASDGDSAFKSSLEPIVTPGDAAGSTIVKAIKGELSSQEMPIGGWNSNGSEKEQTIVDWIDSIDSL